MPPLLQTLCRHEFLVASVASVYASRSVEFKAGREVPKVKEAFERLGKSRTFDISSESDVRDLLSAKKIVNLQMARA